MLAISNAGLEIDGGSAPKSVDATIQAWPVWGFILQSYPRPMIESSSSDLSATIAINPIKALPLRLVVGWSVGSFAAATMYQVTTVLLLRYLVEYVSLAAVAAGALISLTKIFDAFIDPFIGTMSDRTRSRWGRRRPFILVGGFVSAVSLACLFSLPHIDNIGLRWVMVATALIVNATGYALLSIPHLAMPVEMTRDFNERTYLMSFRIGGLSLAQLSGTVLGPYLIASYGGGAKGHSVMGVIIGAIILTGAVVCFFATRGAPQTRVETDSGFTTGQKIKLAFGNRPFVNLISSKMANLTAAGWYFSLLPFLFTTVGKVGYARLGLYFFVQGLATLGAQPIWFRVTQRIGKKKTFYLASVLYGLGIATWSLMRVGEQPIFTILRAGAVGFLGGGTLLAATSMLPDAIEHDYDRTGLRREGIFAGVYATVEKASAAVAATMVGAALSFGGYIQGAGGASVQPTSAVTTIRLACFAPLFFCCLAAVLLTRYQLPDKSVNSLGKLRPVKY